MGNIDVERSLRKLREFGELIVVVRGIRVSIADIAVAAMEQIDDLHREVTAQAARADSAELELRVARLRIEELERVAR